MAGDDDQAVRLVAHSAAKWLTLEPETVGPHLSRVFLFDEAKEALRKALLLEPWAPRFGEPTTEWEWARSVRVRTGPHHQGSTSDALPRLLEGPGQSLLEWLHGWEVARLECTCTPIATAVHMNSSLDWVWEGALRREWRVLHGLCLALGGSNAPGTIATTSAATSNTATTTTNTATTPRGRYVELRTAAQSLFVLVTGRPGAGKSMLVRALARDLGFRFLPVREVSLGLDDRGRDHLARGLWEAVSLTLAAARASTRTRKKRGCIVYLDHIDAQERVQLDVTLAKLLLLRLELPPDHPGRGLRVVALARSREAAVAGGGVLRELFGGHRRGGENTKQHVHLKDLSEDDLATMLSRSLEEEVSFAGGGGDEMKMKREEETETKANRLVVIGAATKPLLRGMVPRDVDRICRRVLRVHTQGALEATYFRLREEDGMYEPCAAGAPGAAKMRIFDVPRGCLRMPSAPSPGLVGVCVGEYAAAGGGGGGSQGRGSRG